MPDGTQILNFPPATARGPKTGTDDVTLRAVAVLTGSYVYTDAVVVLGWSSLLLTVLYVQGDETTVQIIAQRAKTTDGTIAGTTWRNFGIVQVPAASGISEGTKHVLQLTKANFDASDNAEFNIDCTGKQLVRFGVKATGGTPTGTLGIDAAGGMIAVAVTG